MAKRDYYEVLGVAKGATYDEIKKNFRNKARNLHPDNKESGDEAAFKELAEAYEVLSDEQKRTVYDRYGHEGVKGSTRGYDNVDFSAFQGFGVDDLIEALFGGGMRSGGFGRTSGPQPGNSLKYDMELEFLESIFGVEKKITVKRLEDCKTCTGSGAAEGSKVASCTTCGGVGQVRQMVNMLFIQSYQVISCPNCQGSGEKIEKPCKDCNGLGLTRTSREFELKVPAGCETGSRLRLTNCGDKGRRGAPYGDLFVVLHVKEHKQLVRDGDTIHVKQSIGFSLAALGGEALVPSVDGNKVLKIPAGVHTGSTLVMRELGVPRFNSTRRGDQIVHIVVDTPTNLSSEEKQLLTRLAEIRKESLTVPKKDEKKEEKTDEKSSDQRDEKTDDKRDSKKSRRDERRESGKKSEKKDEESILEKIVDAFKPKNGDNEPK